MIASPEAVQRLVDLLPVHYTTRDLRPDGQLGPLTALLSVVAGELEILEEDARRLHDAWFIETCEEWVVPYLADLIGLADLPPAMGSAVSRRALVANTVAYRRRKGTVAVLEQVSRDVTGWPSRAVEHHPLLIATAHANHVYPDRLATTDTRRALAHDVAAVWSPPSARRALDERGHTVEVRRIESRRGRYGIRNIAVFPFSTQVARIGAPGDGSAAAVGPDNGWSRTRVTAGWHAFDPLARSIPLFAPAAPESAIESLADEGDLPVPLRPRRLLELLRSARSGAINPRQLPLGVRIGVTGAELAPERIRVCGLEDLAAGPEPQVMVDALTGRLRAYRNGAAYVPAVVFVRYAYGTSAEVGAGPYDRSQRHEVLLAGDLWSPPVHSGVAVPQDIQVAVSSSAPPGTPHTHTDIASALAATEAAWADPSGTALGATATVSITDSNEYRADPVTADLVSRVPTGTRLVIVAARWRPRELPNGEIEEPQPGRYGPTGLRPHLRTTMRITGEPGSSVVIDGALIEGDLVIEAGDLSSLTLAHCTVTGTAQVQHNDTLSVRVERCFLGAIDAAATVPLVRLSDSVIDPQELGAGVPAVRAPGGQVSIEASTIRGDLEARTLDASSCLLEGRTTVAHRQVGCVRFSYVGPASRTPRRYRCVPAGSETVAGSIAPVYVSTDPASPAYLTLASSCPPEIATGGERESEMGVHHHLFRPLRVRAAGRQLAPYLPVGAHLGMFGS